MSETTDADEVLMNRLNDHDADWSAEALLLGSDAPEGARGHIEVYGNSGDDEWVETLSDAVTDLTDVPFEVTERGRNVADIWLFSA